ncbi:MAG TPA: hypothetical protein VM345_16470 [Acidimicrobiales bacterium]|nr:hypothetical protein [Acidimicrobiales bacterium]
MQHSPPQAQPTNLSTVIRPGAPRWLVRPGALAGVLMGAATLAALVAAALYTAEVTPQDQIRAAIGAIVILTLPFLPAGAIAWRYRHDRLIDFFGNATIGGVRIEGAALAMLEDIQSRFDYARRLIDEVPTGIDWCDVEDDVAVVTWDAGEHAARVSQLDRELVDMAYAAPGTPQAVLKRRLEERRAEHWQVLLDNQREADDLARLAGNAAAAAKVALARTGSLHALEIVAPSPKAVLARRSLDEARARLALLADVWAELDETTDLTAERLGLNQPQQPQQPQQDPSAS